MKSTSRYWVIGGVALAAIVAAWVFSGFRSTSLSEGRDIKPVLAPELHSSSQDVSAMAATAKIDPKVVVPATGRAFTISRNQDLPVADPLAYVRSLLARSEAGDAAATYEIYMVVSQCNATLEVPSPALLEAYQKMGSGEQYLESLERNLNRCESLTADQAISQGPWLRTAAEQGSVEAKIMFSIDSKSVIGDRSEQLSNPEMLIEYREEAMRNLREAASIGSVDALMSLGGVYDSGVLTEASPVQSLAYYKAVYALAPDPNLQELLVRKARDLSAQEVHSASDQSENILRACCR